MDQVESTLNSELRCFTETVPKQAINIEKTIKKLWFLNLDLPIKGTTSVKSLDLMIESMKSKWSM